MAEDHSRMSHPSDELLELYALERLGDRAEELEGHLLTCSACRDAVQDHAELGLLLRAALSGYAEETSRRGAVPA